MSASGLHPRLSAFAVTADMAIYPQLVSGGDDVERNKPCFAAAEYDSFIVVVRNVPRHRQGQLCASRLARVR
jgi:hypothetical protein